MNELHLFAGAGGGILGSILLGHRVIGAVEINEYCCRVLEQRQRDGMLARFPIFQTDIRDFVRHGYAELYEGRCDIVSGGFPCQPFSNAGKRLGADDERNMWPATRDCVRIIRPRYCFFENVPGLLTSGYFGTIIGDLAEIGYCVRWRILSAAEVGAPHKRDRLWILAYTQGNGLETHRFTERTKTQFAESGDSGQDVADAQRGGCNGRTWSQWETGRSEPQNSGEMADAECISDRPQEIGSKADWADTERSTSGISRSSWWAVEPNVGRMDHGVASRVDRLRAIGNGQVPAVVATAWHLLSEGLIS